VIRGFVDDHIFASVAQVISRAHPANPSANYRDAFARFHYPNSILQFKLLLIKKPQYSCRLWQQRSDQGDVCNNNEDYRHHGHNVHNPEKPDPTVNTFDILINLCDFLIILV
jgi:hypothetical protein